MNRRTFRRIANSAAMLSALALLALWVRSAERDLRATSFTTGYLLLSAIGVLALYNLRKKLPFLPLGSSATWLQWHLYLGIGSLGIFALHVGTFWPRGILDSVLAGIYLLTVGSGILGLYFTRTIPPQLARTGEEFIYERIPAQRRGVARQASEAILQSVASSGATTLAAFYHRRLFDYFERARGVAYMLRPTAALRRSLMGEMVDLARYLSEQERGAAERIFALIRRKDDLDFHEARQRLLKVWLFGHIALTYVLLSLAILHGVLAHAFSGGGE